MSGCYLLRKSEPKIAVVYVYPLGAQFDPLALRFVRSYQGAPTPIDHELYIIANGGEPSPIMIQMFQEVDCQWMVHDNTGWDIGAFQAASRTIPCKLMLFFGNSGYIRHPDWMKRVTQSWLQHGEALYGSMGNLGDMRLGIYPHIRTTGFWCNPQMLDNYPGIVEHPAQRYPFEHGNRNFTAWVRENGLHAWVINAHSDLDWPHWNDDPNGFRRGNQGELLFGDRIADLPI